MAENLRIGVCRGDDLLALTFELVRLRIDLQGEAGPQLVPIGPDAYLIVEFQGQHIVEDAFTSDIAADAPPARSALAAPSRLVFRLTGAIPFNLASILAWNLPPLEPSLATPADVGDGLTDPLKTAIELPWGVLLSPSPDTHWDHAVDIIASPLGDQEVWIEAWQTRLLGESPGTERVWVVGALPDPDPFLSLSATTFDDRQEIFVQSRDRTGQQGVPDIPFKRLALSTLGGDLDLEATWDDPSLPVANWRHLATMGRDQFVRVVERGYLYPFGHRATWTTITERRFTAENVAYLHQRTFITVVERLRFYADDQRYPAQLQRGLPFSRVRIDTEQTPDLDADLSDIGGWPTFTGQPYRFQLAGLDQVEAWQDFTLPLAFVPYSKLQDGVPYADIVRATPGWNDEDRSFGATELAGKNVALAEPASGEIDTTRLSTQVMRFTDTANPSTAPLEAPFFPQLDSVDGRLATLQRLFGVNAPVSLRYADIYLINGFDVVANPAQLFLAFNGQTLALSLPAQQYGGVMAPDLNLVGISRSLGPVSGRPRPAPPESGGDADNRSFDGGRRSRPGPVTLHRSMAQNANQAEIAASLATISEGSFEPESYFGDSTRLLGDINLTYFLKKVEFFRPADGVKQINLLQQLPRVRTMEALQDLLETPQQYVSVPTYMAGGLPNATGVVTGEQSTCLWKPKVSQTADDAIVGTNPRRAGDTNRRETQLWLAVRRTISPDGEDARYLVQGRVTDFDLRLFNILIIEFNSLSFVSDDGNTPQVDPGIRSIRFTGPLAFLTDLQGLLEKTGIDVPFNIYTDAVSVSASYRLDIPKFSLGAFNFENMSLATSLRLPFRDEPLEARLGISERRYPFLVTVSFLGGGGFFGLGVRSNGDFNVEVAIEAGGKLGIDVGVAKGSIYALCGIYFALGSGETASSVQLSGYVRAGGSVDVLSIATVSIEFYIALTYQERESEGLTESYVAGEASVRACIEMAFWSKCVSFSVYREFAGSRREAETGSVLPSVAALRFLADGRQAEARAPLQRMSAQDTPNSRSEGFADVFSTEAWSKYCSAFA
jgi:hypothetical protein